jgi:hypothetical protein
MTLQSWDLAPEAFEEHLADCPGDAYLMAERADQVALARWDDARDQRWTRGHLFTGSWHLRWRRLGTKGGVRLVACGDDAPVPGDAPDHPPEELPDEAKDRHVVLWGRRQSGEDFWLELRIPHVMAPPLLHPAPQSDEPPQSDHTERRLLQVTTYRDPDTHRHQWHRLTGIARARSDDDNTTFDLLS